MGTSRTSPDGSKKILAVCIVIVFGLVCFILFSNVWYNAALKVNQTNKPEAQNQEDIQITNVTSTGIIVNYFPLRSYSIQPTVIKRTYQSDENGTKIIREEIANTAESLAKENITIHSYTYEAKYGNEEVYPTIKENNLDTFPNIRTNGMTNNTIIFEWSYGTPAHTTGEDYIYISLDFNFIERQVDLLGYDLLTLKSNLDLFWCFVPYLAFVICGVAFSYVAFSNLQITNAFDTLVKFDSDVKGKKMVEINKTVTNNLGTVVEFPNQLGSFTRLLFGLSIITSKIIVNNICKKHNEKIDSYSNIYPYQKKGLKKIFSKYSKQSFEKISDFLPEFQTIGIFVGFLTAVGVSFSWNVGAALPFVYTVGIVYFFINVGAMFYLLYKTTPKTIIWPIIVLTVGMLAVNFSEIMNFLRTTV